MYLRLLAESLRRGTRRKLLAITAVALGTLGAAALGEILLASGDRLAAELASYGANLTLVPAAGHDALAVERLALVRRIFWRNNIVAVAPLYPLRLRVSVASGAPADAAARSQVAEVLGTWFHHPLEAGWFTGLPATRPTLRLTGRWPRDDDEPSPLPGGEGGETGAKREAVLGRRLAARLAARVGDELRLSLGHQAEVLRVVGIVTSGGEEDDEALVPLAVVDRLAARPDTYLRAEIFARTNPEGRNVRDPRTMTAKQYEAWYCTAYPSSIAFQLHQALPEAVAMVDLGITEATADVIGKLRGVLFALAAVALLGAAIGVTAAMTATVLERRLEAGLLVAIGAARQRVVFFFLSEAALLGGFGGLTGGAAGLVAGRLIGSRALAIQVPWAPVLLPFSVLLGLTVAIAASALPVLRALGRYPAALLKRATA